MAKIMIAGDFCPQNRVKKLIETGETSSILFGMLPYIKDCDYSIINLECPVVFSENIRPIIKNGAKLKCTVKAINFLKETGISCVTTANNHIFDYGDEGISNTIEALNNAEIDYLGIGKNHKDLKKSITVDFDDVKVGIINACENEFSIASYSHGGAFEADPIDLYHEIKNVRNQGCDKVLVIIHGGKEHYPLPTPEMVRRYRFMIDSGADVVINHHQHCHTGYEQYNNGVIFYGIGNFCFDSLNKEPSTWGYGFSVLLSLEKEGLSYEIIPFTQSTSVPYVQPLDASEKDEFMEDLERKNKIISDSDLLRKHFNDYISSSFTPMTISPFQTGLLRKLAWRKLIPNMVGKNFVQSLTHQIRCYAHREALLTWSELNKNKDE